AQAVDQGCDGDPVGLAVRVAHRGRGPAQDRVLHLVARRRPGLLLQQQALLLVDLFSHGLPEFLLRLPRGVSEPLGFGVGLAHEYVAPDPRVADVAADRRFVEAALTHRLAVEVHAVLSDLVALDVHEEGAAGAGHGEHRFFARAGTDDERVRLGVRAWAQQRQAQVPEL